MLIPMKKRRLPVKTVKSLLFSSEKVRELSATDLEEVRGGNCQCVNGSCWNTKPRDGG